MEDQELHRLLQLKRCADPSAETVEEFILEFQRRQRISSLNSSVWDLFKERFFFFLSEFQVPKMAYVVATALALISSAFLVLHQAPPQVATPTMVSYPVVTKSFSIYHSSSTLVPQSNIIPVSFRESTDDDKFFSPDALLPKRKLDFIKTLKSF